MEPPRLLNLAIQILLWNKDLVINALKYLPKEIFPILFVEAYKNKCVEILKAMVLVWPFPSLPLGSLMPFAPSTENENAVFEGLDDLLAQNVQPKRCKLQVLDLQNSGHEFWTQWAGVKFSSNSSRLKPVTKKCARMKKDFPYVEVFTSILVRGRLTDSDSSVQKWARKRKGVHVCFVNATIASLNSSPGKHLYTKTLCIKDLTVLNSWTPQTLKRLTYLMSKMKNLERLTIRMRIAPTLSYEEQEENQEAISQWTSLFLQLRHLRELFLQSPFFLRGHLGQLLSSLSAPLKVFLISNCVLTASDLTHLLQSPHMTQLKDLSLINVRVSDFTQDLGALLEKNTATLEYLDLSFCEIQDFHLEFMLPALSTCSELSFLKLHGNYLSMASLEKLLRATSAISLIQEIYPGPLECINPNGELLSDLFDEFCSQLEQVLRDLGHPRCIYVLPKPCHDTALMFGTMSVIKSCRNCLRQCRRISFGL